MSPPPLALLEFFLGAEVGANVIDLFPQGEVGSKPGLVLDLLGKHPLVFMNVLGRLTGPRLVKAVVVPGDEGRGVPGEDRVFVAGRLLLAG